MREVISKKPKTEDKPAGDALLHLESIEDNKSVLDALSLMIERAELRIGDRLPPEIDIAKKLNVGRSKVREALIAWQNMGIVTRNKKAGTRLATEVSSKDLHLPVTLRLEAESLLRTHAVRRPLEIEVIRIATRNMTEQHARIILARSAELKAIYEAGEDWRAADVRFHIAIHEASGNPLFEQLIRQIQQGFHAIYEAPFGQRHLGQETIPLHPVLARAITQGDETLAAATMGKIMDMLEDEVREFMASKSV